MLGIVTFIDTIRADHNLAPRTFDSFAAATAEAALSRLYAGIHLLVRQQRRARFRSVHRPDGHLERALQGPRRSRQ